MVEALKVLPKGLWSNFDMTMTRIEKLPYEHQVHFAKQTLLWISKTARPLKVNELRHAMLISETPLNFKPSTIPAGQLFVEYCFGFVVIDTKSDIVRLAHFSIDEYLRQRNFNFLAPANTTIALACINYMLLPWLPNPPSSDESDPEDMPEQPVELQNGSLDTDSTDHGALLSQLELQQSHQTRPEMPQNNSAIVGIFETVLKKYPLMDYGVAYWGYHAAKSFSGSVSDAVNIWLQNEKGFMFWGWLDERNSHDSLYAGRNSQRFEKRHGDERRGLKRCHVAARYGIWELMPHDPFELQAELNSTTENGDTPLMIAAERGHIVFVESLLAQQSLNLNEVDLDGNTALCRAVNTGQSSIFHVLLEHPGVNVTFGSPLHFALSLGATDMIKALLTRKDLDINAFWDKTALHESMYNNLNFQFVKSILKRDDLLPRFLRTPYPRLDYTIVILNEDSDIMTYQELQDFPQIVRALAEDFWVRGQRNQADRCLGWFWSWVLDKSELGSHLDIYLQWIETGLDRKMVDENGNTILHTAAKNTKHAKILQQLVQHGFDVEMPGAEGGRALQAAAFNGNITGLELLVDAGADLNTQDNDGWTALHYAAAAGEESIVQVLLDRGADKNARTKLGLSAIHSAARGGRLGVVEQLLRYGVNPTSITHDGETLLFSAVSGGNENMVKLVLGANGSKDINCFTRKNGMSPLVVAALMKRSDLVKILVENGADVKAGHADGYTALHAAAAKDNLEIVRYLLDHGADPNAEDIYFGTPFTEAVESMASVRRELLSHGGDISIESRYGRTPVDFSHALEVLELEFGAIEEKPVPVSPSEIRRCQVRRVKALLKETLRAHRGNETQAWCFSILGHLLAFLGNYVASRTAFEQNVCWDDNYVVQRSTRCQACESDPATGSIFICACCTRTILCLKCFSQHAAFRRVLFEQFSADSIFESCGRDERWAGFLEINGLMTIRYRHAREQDTFDVTTEDGRQQRIMRLVIEQLDTSEPQGISANFPYCTGEHTFLQVPSWEWLIQSPGTVNTQGLMLEDWLQGLYELYSEKGGLITESEARATPCPPMSVMALAV